MCVFGGRVVVFVVIPSDRSICVTHTNIKMYVPQITKRNYIQSPYTKKKILINPQTVAPPSDVTSVIRVNHKSSLVVCVFARAHGRLCV